MLSIVHLKIRKAFNPGFVPNSSTRRGHLNGAMSVWRKISCGFLQSLVLYLTLSKIFTSDLGKDTESTESIIFVENRAGKNSGTR